MNATEPHRSPVYRQLDVYEESWKKDHDSVQECWAWEDAAAVGVATAFLIQHVTQAWRDRVFRGVEEYTEAANESFRALFESWRRITQAALARLASLAQTYDVVEGVSELQKADTQIRDRLANWQPPRLSAAVGLRNMTLTPEAASELDRILAQPTEHPPEPTRPRMAEMTLAELRRRPKTA